MSEEIKAKMTYGPPLPPDDPAFRKAIGEGLGAMFSVQEIINRKLAEQGLTINDVGCVTYNPETGKVKISKGWYGP